VNRIAFVEAAATRRLPFVGSSEAPEGVPDETMIVVLATAA